jgi:hypothetical protein
MLPSPSPNTPRDTLGHVVSIGGSHAGVRLTVPAASDAVEGQRPTVGKFLALQTPASSVVGVITEVDGGSGEAGGALTVRVDLLGEIRRTDNGFTQFQRGITGYPVVGDKVELLGSEGLRAVYDTSGADTINIGQLQQDSSIGAYVKVDEMLRKHFALFGTTGVGKSSGVAVILRQVLAAKRNLRVFLIDPHNEYARSFRDQAQVLNPRNLKLPFWLFNFEETVDVLFRGRPQLARLGELDSLAETGVRAGVELEDGRQQGIRDGRPAQLVLLIEGQLLLGFLPLAQVTIRSREREVSGAEAGKKRTGLLEVRNRGGELAPGRVDPAQAVLGFACLRTLVHERLVEGPALVRVAGVQQALGQHQPGGKVSGLESQRLPQRGCGRLGPGQVHLRPSQVVGPARVPRRERVRPLEARRRQLVLLVGVEQHTELPVAFRVLRFLLRAPIGLRHRLADARLVGLEGQVRERRQRRAGDRRARYEQERDHEPPWTEARDHAIPPGVEDSLTLYARKVGYRESAFDVLLNWAMKNATLA